MRHSVDPKTAPAEVPRALPSMDQDKVASLLAARQSRKGRSLPRPSAASSSAPSALIDLQSRIYSITAHPETSAVSASAARRRLGSRATPDGPFGFRRGRTGNYVTRPNLVILAIPIAFSRLLLKINQRHQAQDPRVSAVAIVWNRWLRSPGTCNRASESDKAPLAQGNRANEFPDSFRSSRQSPGFASVSNGCTWIRKLPKKLFNRMP